MICDRCNSSRELLEHVVSTADTDPVSVITLNAIRMMTTLFTNFVKYG